MASCVLSGRNSLAGNVWRRCRPGDAGEEGCMGFRNGWAPTTDILLLGAWNLLCSLWTPQLLSAPVLAWLLCLPGFSWVFIVLLCVHVIHSTFTCECGMSGDEIIIVCVCKIKWGTINQTPQLNTDVMWPFCLLVAVFWLWVYNILAFYSYTARVRVCVCCVCVWACGQLST